jgi:hypothetical protein
MMNIVTFDSLSAHNYITNHKQNKITRKEQNRINKQAQRDKLIAKYGDEEYRKMHAKQIAENRKKHG